MMPLFQAKRRFRQFGVELEQSRLQVTGPGQESRRTFAFVKDGVHAGVPCGRESDLLSQHQIDGICRRLGLSEGSI